MTLQLLHSEFPYILGKFDFLFYQCSIHQTYRIINNNSHTGNSIKMLGSFGKFLGWGGGGGVCMTVRDTFFPRVH
jgi:hypothetical protein